MHSIQQTKNITIPFIINFFEKIAYPHCNSNFNIQIC